MTATRGPQFLLDRSIFAPESHAYRHPQPADRGEVWVGGDKRVLIGVHWQRGELRHALRGTTPPRGTNVRCLLDAQRRDDASAAHAALHVLLSLFGRSRLGALAQARVVGGRQFAVAARWNSWSGQALKDLMDATNDALRRRLEVRVEFVPRTSIIGVDSQPFEDATTMPGPPDVVRVVRLGEASALPCDGTFPDHTGGVGRVTARRVDVGRTVRAQFHVGRTGGT